MYPPFYQSLNDSKLGRISRKKGKKLPLKKLCVYSKRNVEMMAEKTNFTGNLNTLRNFKRKKRRNNPIFVTGSFWKH
jgi:hypothetical protein